MRLEVACLCPWWKAFADMRADIHVHHQSWLTCPGEALHHCPLHLQQSFRCRGHWCSEWQWAHAAAAAALQSAPSKSVPLPRAYVIRSPGECSVCVCSLQWDKRLTCNNRCFQERQHEPLEHADGYCLPVSSLIHESM